MKNKHRNVTFSKRSDVNFGPGRPISAQIDLFGQSDDIKIKILDRVAMNRGGGLRRS